MDEVTSLLEQLVAIDSVNPDLAQDGAGEKEIAQFVADWLASRGFKTELDEPQPGRTSVCARAPGSGGGRSLILYAHLDTVGPGEMDSPFSPRRDGDRLYGLGTVDMKGGLAAVMMTAANAADKPLSGDLIVAAVSDEEYASIGCQSFVERWSADAAVVTEPTGLRPCLAHKGFVWLEVEIQGKAAHGSRPDLGIDAIAKAGRALVAIEQLGQSLATRQAHPLLGHGSSHMSKIAGGRELSTYPELCRFSIERRTVPGETASTVSREVRATLEGIAETDPDFSFSLRPLLERPPFQVEQSEPIVQATFQSAEAVLGGPVEPMVHSGWMDAAIFSDAGIPTVVIGPGGGGAHEPDEWVSISDVKTLTAILDRVVDQICA